MLQPNFTPFPALTTERLLLRKVTLDDAKEIYFLRSDKMVLTYLSKEPEASIGTTKEFINRVNGNSDTGDGILWAITLKDDPGQVIGTICYWNMQKANYRSEIGYALHPDHWRKGIMKEAIIGVIDYGFSTLGLHSIEARIGPGNIASAAVLESTGFVKEAYFKEDFFFNGKFEDTIVYSLLNK